MGFSALLVWRGGGGGAVGAKEDWRHTIDPGSHHKSGFALHS